jgi:hypothetical protein
MSNEQSTVTYSVAEILGQINQKLDKIDERLTNLEIGQARIEEKLGSVDKRLENQEFITRGILVGLVLAFLAGFAKLFGIIGNP